MKSQPLKRFLNLILGYFVFVLVFNQFVGWAVNEKSWLEKLWITLGSGGVFGAVGAGLGLIVGGIGLALGGGAIGIAGWLTFGVLGFGTGALGGSIWAIIQDPQNYDFDIFRFSLVVIVALAVAVASVLFASKLGKCIKGYNESPDVRPR